MIAVCLNGRLGNQLFQYALALSLSKKYSTFYVIDDKLVSDSVKKYFERISLSDNKYFRKALRVYFNDKRLVKIKQTGFEDIGTIIAQLKDNVYCEGFFQSVKYIDNIASELRSVFRIKMQYEDLFKKKYAHLFENEKIIAVHYRLGDYTEWGGDALGGVNLVLPENYYENALKLIPNLDTYKILLVTDDIIGVQNRLSFIKNKLVISDQEIIDFQILMHADKLVISNSTFVWWAAVLNKKKAQVFVPEFWVGFKIRQEYPVGIINPEFVKVSF